MQQNKPGTKDIDMNSGCQQLRRRQKLEAVGQKN
jgi:hypothetical protein